MSAPRSLRPILAAGFTLIEVMIALLIGLIGIVVMMSTFSVSEGFKRTATSGTDAQINGAVGLYMLEREIRQAGFGMNAMMAMGCTSVRVWNSTSGNGVDLRYVPFEINPAGIPAGDANTDTFLVTYGTADSFVAGIPADQGPAGPATKPFTLDSNWDAFRNGDLFVSVQPGGGPGGAASCVMHEATMTAPASGNCGIPVVPAANVLTHNAVTYKSARSGCNSVAATRNSATGIRDAGGSVVPVVKKAQGGMIFNMGSPVVTVYAIRGGNLTSCNWNISDCTVATNYDVIVNDIVSMRLVYGMNLTPVVNSLPGDGVTTWGRAPLTGNVFLPSRVMATSMEIVARSNIKEKPVAGGACDATPSPTRPDRAQDWMYQSMAGAGINLTNVFVDPTEYMCYRYKLYQTTIPLRNLIWRP